MTKTKRNDPCTCGSGKKYKKCCINKPPVPQYPASRCAACGVDLEEIQEMDYMLDDRAWASLTGNNTRACLCIGCIERNVKRRLVETDFQSLMLPLHVIGNQSPRLLERMGLTNPPQIEIYYKAELV